MLSIPILKPFTLGKHGLVGVSLFPPGCTLYQFKRRLL